MTGQDTKDTVPHDGVSAASYTIDRTSQTPYYAQLKEQILDRIQRGVLRPGDAVPSETELCRVLEVSRPTVRQALAELALEGYVTKEQGKGTFVAQPKIAGQFLSNVQSFSEEMRQQRRTPSTKVLQAETVSGFHEANKRLALPLSDPLVALRRVRYADQVPIVYVETYLPAARFPGLIDVDLEDNSLYETLEEHFGTRVSRVVREIEAVGATSEEAELLGIAPGQAICLVHTVAYASNTIPIEYSVARYRGDRTTFNVELYR